MAHQKKFENVDVKKSYVRAKKLAVKAKKKKQERKEMVEQRHELIDTVPRTLVFRRGRIGGELTDLIDNFKESVMMPYTAKKLKTSRRLRLFKDLIPVAQDIYITHFLMFSVTMGGSRLKIARIPRGPTLEFDITAFSTISDVMKFGKKMKLDVHNYSSADTAVPPLVVLNGFGNDQTHLKLAATTFRSMFPLIDTEKFRVSQCRRVCLFNYNAADNTIDWRHYYVSYSTKGSTGKGVTSSEMENDVLDEMKNAASMEGVDLEENDEAKDKPSNNNKKKKSSNKRGVNLREMGPRLTLRLNKIYEGVNDGEVLYHSTMKKSLEEIAQLRQRHENKRALKEKRKHLQEENVEKKLAEKQKKTDNKEKKKLRAREAMEREVIGQTNGNDSDDSDSNDDSNHREEEKSKVGNKRQRSGSKKF